MSRIGRRPVDIPSGVEVEINGSFVKVKGPKGELATRFSERLSIDKENTQIIVKRASEDKYDRALHGLTRTLIANMVTGVSQGFQKELEISGVGYRAQKKGNNLELRVGHSHPVLFAAPDGIEIEVPVPTKILVKGRDKQMVGNVAAKIRDFKKPEPYKRKGIKYQGEHIRHKAGKTAK